MKSTITITTLSRPQFHGMITHQVKLPGWKRPIGVGSIEDARKTAAGYQPRPGEEVTVNEVAPAPKVTRTRRLHLTR